MLLFAVDIIDSLKVSGALFKVLPKNEPLKGPNLHTVEQIVLNLNFLSSYIHYIIFIELLDIKDLLYEGSPVVYH